MEKHTQEILEAIVTNNCHAVLQIAQTDKSIDESYRDFMKWSVDRIRREPDAFKQIKRTNLLLEDIYVKLSKDVQDKNTRS